METPDLPGNSNHPLGDGAKPTKKIDQVVVNPATFKKASFGARFREAVTGGSTDSVFDYVVFEVIVPAAKDMFADAVSSGVERLIFGETRGSRRPRGRGSSSLPARNATTNYTSYSGRPGGAAYAASRSASVASSRGTHEFGEILLATRPEADAVLTCMYDLLEKYEAVCVADLYELVGISPAYTDHNYGWTALTNASYKRTREGYVLVLPKPDHLE